MIFFDSYNDAIDTVANLTDLPAETRFVVAVRTSVQDVRLHEIRAKLPSPLDRIDLNGVDRDDLACFRSLLRGAGAATSNLQAAMRRSRDFRDVIVSLYNNFDIKKKIETEFAPLLEDGEFRRAFIVSHLLTWIGQHSDAAFIRSVTDCDAYAAIAGHRETAGDIFALDDGELQVRSAVFSEYLIQTHLTADDIIDSVYLVLIEAMKRRGFDRRYQAILSNLMRVTVLSKALREAPNRIRSISGLFEKLRRDVDMKKWPLFWLQYSILMTDAGDLETAESFIRTAYARAEESEGFHTFQIDTYAIKLFLQIEQSKKGTGIVERFDDIMQKMDGMRQIIRDESRRFHAIQVLQHIEPFVVSRIGEFSRGEKLSVVQHLNLLDRELREISREDRVSMNVDPIRDSVSRALRGILDFDCVHCDD